MSSCGRRVHSLARCRREVVLGTCQGRGQSKAREGCGRSSRRLAVAARHSLTSLFPLAWWWVVNNLRKRTFRPTSILTSWTTLLRTLDPCQRLMSCRCFSASPRWALFACRPIVRRTSDRPRLQPTTALPRVVDPDGYSWVFVTRSKDDSHRDEAVLPEESARQQRQFIIFLSTSIQTISLLEFVQSSAAGALLGLP